jgi:hypothetical protein
MLAPASIALGQLSVLNTNSPTPFGFFGGSIASVPDCNGDGIADVLVGAPNEGELFASSGKAYLYSGANGVLLQDFVSPHEEADGNFGESVAGVPDVNGDGRGDLLIGAPDEDPGGVATPDDAGRAYIFSGLSGDLLVELRSPVQQTDGEFGGAVAGLADINGDGRGDVAVGGQDETAGADPARCGRVYIYSGASGQFLRSIRPPTPEQGGQFGCAVAAVPDANGDGTNDLVVGARGESSLGVAAAGRAHLYAGGTWGRLRTYNSPGRETGGRFGHWVDGVASIDGDGRGDVVVGAPREDPGLSPSDVGRAYVYSGSTGVLRFKLLPPTNDAFAEFGIGVAGLQDATGDGVPDLAVGAWNHQFNGHPNNCGYVHVYSGANGLRAFTMASPSRVTNGSFGISVAGSPDVNGNGRGEILVGATGEAGGAGRAFIWRR